MSSAKNSEPCVILSHKTKKMKNLRDFWFYCTVTCRAGAQASHAHHSGMICSCTRGPSGCRHFASAHRASVVVYTACTHNFLPSFSCTIFCSSIFFLWYIMILLWYTWPTATQRHNDTATSTTNKKKTLRIRTNYKCFGFHSCHKPKMNGQTNMLVINIGSSFIFSRPAWPVMEACEKRRRRIDERIRSILPFAMRPLVCTEHSGSWSVCFSKVICDGEFDLGKWRVRFIVWNRRMASMGPG